MLPAKSSYLQLTTDKSLLKEQDAPAKCSVGAYSVLQTAKSVF